VAVGKAQLADTREVTRLDAFVHDCLERFRLLRPEMEVALELEEEAAALALAVPYGLRHALINLLNNAADASEANGSVTLALTVQARGDQLALQVRDQGAGTLPPEALGHTFVSSKSTGLGIGFALADATAERLGGTLSLHPSPGGSETVLTLPLSTLRAR
jgi:two-component system sensor histidine kinase RegB